MRRLPTLSAVIDASLSLSLSLGIFDHICELVSSLDLIAAMAETSSQGRCHQRATTSLSTKQFSWWLQVAAPMLSR